MQKFIEMVRAANPNRNFSNIDRRLDKLQEELGESAQAYLSVTSKFNKKRKTWADVREENCDILIVALDIALTHLPNEDKSSKINIPAKESFSGDRAQRFLRFEISRKMAEIYAELEDIRYSESVGTSAEPTINRYATVRATLNDMVTHAYTLVLQTESYPTIEKSKEAILKNLEKEMIKKLEKWTRNMTNMTGTVDDAV